MALALALIVPPIVVSFILASVYRDPAWYNALRKPALTPPSWMMSIICTSLYVILGIAATSALRGKKDKFAWLLVLSSIVVSLFFLPVFFGLHSLMGGAMITLLSFVVGLALFYNFAFVHNNLLATVLITFYTAWLGFASYIGWSTMALNT